MIGRHPGTHTKTRHGVVGARHRPEKNRGRGLEDAGRLEGGRARAGRQGDAGGLAPVPRRGGGAVEAVLGDVVRLGPVTGPMLRADRAQPAAVLDRAGDMGQVPRLAGADRPVAHPADGEAGGYGGGDPEALATPGVGAADVAGAGHRWPAAARSSLARNAGGSGVMSTWGGGLSWSQACKWSRA